MFQEQQQPSAATGGMGSLLRGRNPLSPKSPRTRPNSSDLEGSLEKSPSAKSASSFRLPRSRIGTETSVETALENVPGAAGSVSSFEEELFRQDSRNLLHHLGS